MAHTSSKRCFIHCFIQPMLGVLSDDSRTTCRASSTLDRNRARYGAANMLSSDLSSCWNSAQGSPQHVYVYFHRTVRVASFDLMFQGGFVGQDVHVRYQVPGATASWERATMAIDPIDSNDLQSFACPLPSIQALALTFRRSTDFYGRVVIYRLQVWGTASSPRGNE